MAQLSSLATETASEFPEDEYTGAVPSVLADLEAEPEVGADDSVDDVPEDQGGQ